MTPQILSSTPYTRIKKLEDTFSLSQWAQPATTILRDNFSPDSGHDEGHIVRVVRNAIWFCENGDWDVIIPAAILHDLVNVSKSDKEQRKLASRLSADKAINLLHPVLPFKNSIHSHLIHNAIEAHSYSANVQCLSKEARAIQDANRIDCTR